MRTTQNISPIISQNTGPRLKVHFVVALVVVFSLLTGCGDPFWLPRAHKIEVQQGNLLSAAQISSVKTGMAQQEVAQLIGVPVTQSAFHPNRWDYMFTRGPAGKRVAARRFSVFFDSAGVVEKTEENFAEESGEIIMPKYWFQSPNKRKPVGVEQDDEGETAG